MVSLHLKCQRVKILTDMHMPINGRIIELVATVCIVVLNTARGVELGFRAVAVKR